METYKYDTWDDGLNAIKQNAPTGLYEQWKELEPHGVLKWAGALELSDITENSYNWLDKDANNVVFQAVYLHPPCESDNGLIAVAFHTNGDVRGNYTDYFLFKQEDVLHLLAPKDDEQWKELGGEVYD